MYRGGGRVTGHQRPLAHLDCGLPGEPLGAKLMNVSTKFVKSGNTLHAFCRIVGVHNDIPMILGTPRGADAPPPRGPILGSRGRIWVFPGAPWTKVPPKQETSCKVKEI